MHPVSEWDLQQLEHSADFEPAGSLVWRDPFSELKIASLGRGLGDYRLRHGGDLAVDCHADGKIIVRPLNDIPQFTIDHFLADQVFPRLLAHAGSLVVHAGAIVIGDGAFMLVGQSGRGKSTMVASFDQTGQQLIGDDAMVISFEAGEAQVRAVYPSLRLMPDSIDALMGDTVTAGPVAHYSSKERIEVSGSRSADEAALPIRAIFAIGAPAEQIAFRRMPMARACMALVENSFSLNPSDVQAAEIRLAQATQLARAVPMFEIDYPRDYARLPEVRAAILGQLAALEAG